MTTVEKCPICTNEKFVHFITATDYTVSKKLFHIKKCDACGLMITSPRPSDNELADYYISDNYISHSAKAKTWLDLIYKSARKFTMNWKYSIVANNQNPKTILDYGCGTGDFLVKMKSKGWQVQGVEPSEKARQVAQDKLPGSQITAELGRDPNLFQVITLWHVLEHVSDLNNIVTTLKSKLTKDGRIYIAVPNPNSWESIYYKSEWAAFDAPRHLWHFTKPSITKLLTNHGLSLEAVIPMKLDAFYISILSESYKHDGRKTITGTVRAIFNAIKSNQKASHTGEYSSLIYVAKNEL